MSRWFFLNLLMVLEPVLCPGCAGDDVVKHGRSRAGKQQIADMALNGSEIHDTA